ncbi:MAG: ABC transporter permease [Bacteroidales bacterium]|nr:ABC transporter permease [Bacteroidales bacterium]
MRGVVEEKTNRIVEVIISSVKPFQLMAGKIFGIGLVGITQFIAWLALTFIIVFITGQVLGFNQNPDVQQLTSQSFFETAPVNGQNVASESPPELASFYNQLSEINFPVVIGSFLFYFLGGFILYGSMFAAVGAAVDSETDTQQFMLPVTIPLIISIIMMINAFTNPEGDLAVIFSIIPFTSPVVMMARIGFGIPIEQVFLSVIVLIGTILFTIGLLVVYIALVY